MHFGLIRFVTNAVSAVVVLAAFGALFRWLAGRALGYSRVPRMRVPGRRGTLAGWLIRAAPLLAVQPAGQLGH